MWEFGVKVKTRRHKAARVVGEPLVGALCVAVGRWKPGRSICHQAVGDARALERWARCWYECAQETGDVGRA